MLFYIDIANKRKRISYIITVTFLVCFLILRTSYRLFQSQGIEIFARCVFRRVRFETRSSFPFRKKEMWLKEAEVALFAGEFDEKKV